MRPAWDRLNFLTRARERIIEFRAVSRAVQSRLEITMGSVEGLIEGKQRVLTVHLECQAVVEIEVVISFSMSHAKTTLPRFPLAALNSSLRIHLTGLHFEHRSSLCSPLHHLYIPQSPSHAPVSAGTASLPCKCLGSANDDISSRLSRASPSWEKYGVGNLRSRVLSRVPRSKSGCELGFLLSLRGLFFCCLVFGCGLLYSDLTYMNGNILCVMLYRRSQAI